MISAQDIRRLSEITFVLEPIIDKKDCTTRFKDLPGKPLADFLIAGINVGETLEDYADSVIKDGNNQIYSHYVKALKESNKFKAKKYINLGLIEVLLVVIQARLTFKNLDQALNGFIKLLKNSPKQDLQNYQNAFHLAWATSKNRIKQERLIAFDEISSKANNMYERFLQITKSFPEPDFSSYQVSLEYVKGFPTIKRFISEIDEDKGLISSIQDTFNALHEEDPIIKVGWLADLSAAAIFLYLSYQDPDSYVIN
jgi:hypothetical protein